MPSRVVEVKWEIALDYVRTPGAPVTTKASFVIEDRNPGLNCV